jgi:uncharacterized membrane protein
MNRLWPVIMILLPLLLLFEGPIAGPWFGPAEMQALLLVTLVGALFYGIRFLRNRTGGGSSDKAETILRERYAAGELSRAEYQQMLHDLESRNST